jgi:hypothetical protein
MLCLIPVVFWILQNWFHAVTSLAHLCKCGKQNPCPLLSWISLYTVISLRIPLAFWVIDTGSLALIYCSSNKITPPVLYLEIILRIVCFCCSKIWDKLYPNLIGLGTLCVYMAGTRDIWATNAKLYAPLWIHSLEKTLEIKFLRVNDFLILHQSNQEIVWSGCSIAKFSFLPPYCIYIFPYTPALQPMNALNALSSSSNNTNFS